VRAGALDTGLVERKLDALTTAAIPDDVYVAAGLERSLEPRGDDPWDQLGGWRVGEHAWTTWRINDVDVRVRGDEVVVGAGEPVRARARREGSDLLVGSRRYATARDGDVLWLGHDGASWALVEAEFLVGAAGGAAAQGGPVKSPMPGTVLVVRARQGEEVTAGQALFVVEAMKMEHTVTAPVDGVLAEVNVQAGQQVALDQVLALVVSHEE